MYNENMSFNQQDSDFLGVKLHSAETFQLSMTGECIDRIFDTKGNLLEERRGHNLVVNSFLELVVNLIKKQSGYTGIQYWAIGSGENSWDSSMPAPNANETQLTAEIGRVPIASNEISFLTPSYEVSPTPTNILQIKHIFTANECNGVWREFGIFGGNAIASLNSGILINKRHHAVITKTSDMVVERTMRFTLNLS